MALSFGLYTFYFQVFTLNFFIMASVYQLNKGVGRPIMFKGLKGQYIAYLAVGMVLLLVAFAVLYIARVNLLLVLPLVFGSGVGLFLGVGSLSARFGEHGLMKFFARRSYPSYIQFQSRQLFLSLKNNPIDHGQGK